MKFVCMDFDDLKKLFGLIASGSPPNNMSREEWKNMMGNIVIESHKRVTPILLREGAIARAERICGKVDFNNESNIQALNDP